MLAWWDPAISKVACTAVQHAAGCEWSTLSNEAQKFNNDMNNPLVYLCEMIEFVIFIVLTGH